MNERLTSLEDGQEELKAGQFALTKDQARLEEGDKRLQEGEKRLQEAETRLQEAEKRLQEAEKGLKGETKKEMEALTEKLDKTNLDTAKIPALQERVQAVATQDAVANLLQDKLQNMATQGAVAELDAKLTQYKESMEKTLAAELEKVSKVFAAKLQEGRIASQQTPSTQRLSQSTPLNRLSGATAAPGLASSSPLKLSSRPSTGSRLPVSSPPRRPLGQSQSSRSPTPHNSQPPSPQSTAGRKRPSRDFTSPNRSQRRRSGQLAFSGSNSPSFSQPDLTLQTQDYLTQLSSIGTETFDTQEQSGLERTEGLSEVSSNIPNPVATLV